MRRINMKIEHIALYVDHLEEARDFFVTYLGGTSNAGYVNESKGFRSYFITFSDGARLELMNEKDVKPTDKRERKLGYTHLAFSLGSKEKVDEITDKLIKAGFDKISGPRTIGDGYYESCMFGFEDNVIELTV